MSLMDKLKDLLPNKKTPQKMLDILMQDGTIQQYPESFYITDGINCVVCMGQYYHTSLDCENLAWERQHSSEKLKGMYVKDAKSQKMTYCADCSRENYLREHGREDEI